MWALQLRAFSIAKEQSATQLFPGMTLLLMVQEDKSMREPMYFCNIVADIYTDVA